MRISPASPAKRTSACRRPKRFSRTAEAARKSNKQRPAAGASRSAGLFASCAFKCLSLAALCSATPAARVLRQVEAEPTAVLVVRACNHLGSAARSSASHGRRPGRSPAAPRRARRSRRAARSSRGRASNPRPCTRGRHCSGKQTTAHRKTPERRTSRCTRRAQAAQRARGAKSTRASSRRNTSAAASMNHSV